MRESSDVSGTNFLPERFPKGRKAEGNQFEVLHGEGYADDGNGTKGRKNQVGDSNPDAAQQNPQNIHHEGETARSTLRSHDFLTEGKQAGKG
jgi:hypothetical protein